MHWIIVSVSFFTDFEPQTKLVKVTQGSWARTKFDLNSELASLKYSNFSNMKDVLINITLKYPALAKLRRYGQRVSTQMDTSVSLFVGEGVVFGFAFEF